MKKIIALVLLSSLMACGDEEGGHVGVSGVESGGHQVVAEAPLSLAGPSFLRTIVQDIPITPPVSDQFDEQGHIIGIYGVPYVPKSVNPSGGIP